MNGFLLDNKSESILMAELINLTEKFQNDIVHYSLDYDELVEYFHMYMFELVNYSPLNLYNNPLSIFIKEHLGDEIPGCFLDEFKYYEEDAEFKKELNNLINYYLDIINGEFGISNSEFDELYKLSLIDERNSDRYVSYLLSQLIEDNNTTTDEIYKGLVNRFVCRIIDRNGLNVSFKIGRLEKEDDDSDTIAESICEKGIYYVTFNEKHLDLSKIMINLEDIFHEIWHTVQDSEEYNYLGVIKLIKMDDYIRRVLGDSYYDENYNVISYEVDANLHGIIMQASLLREISPITYELNKGWLTRSAQNYNELLYRRERVYEGCEYDIDELFEEVLLKTGKSCDEVFGGNNAGKGYLKEIRFK